MKKKMYKKSRSDMKHARIVRILIGTVVAIFVISILLFYVKSNGIKKTSITTFDQCVEKTGMVMESYPRQCNVDGKTYVETIKDPQR